MGQLRILLWKNFRFCYRHPFKTALFYFVPLLFCSFLVLIVSMMKIDNTPDCDFETLVLPPSHPVFLVSSLICSNSESCVNTTKGYQPGHALLDTLISDKDNSHICPGLSTQEAGSKLRWAIQAANMSRPGGTVDYAKLPAIDFLFRGKLYYYPKDPVGETVLNVAASYLDSIEQLKIGFQLAKFGQMLKTAGFTAANISSIIQDFATLSNVTVFYKSLTNRTEGFANLDEAVAKAQSLNATYDVVWGIVNFINTSKHFQYKIVTHFGTRNNIPTLYLQSLIEMSIIKQQTGQFPAVTLEQKLLPQRCFKNNSAYAPAFSTAALVIGLGFIAIAYTITSEMCAEKAAGLIEFLFIAGVPRWKIKMSWFIFGFVFFVSAAILVAVIFKFVSTKLIQYTDFSIIVIFLVLYGISLLCMCFLVSSIMATAQRAGLLIFISLLAAYLIPQFASMVPDVGYTGGTLMLVKITSFFHSTVAAQIGFAYIFSWEKIGRAATWSNLRSSPDAEDKFGGLQECMAYLIIQCPMYILLSFYFDHVVPSKYGVKWPCYFCCMPSFWSCCGEPPAPQEDQRGENQADVEMSAAGKTPGVSLQRLHKSYGKNKVAVDNLSVVFYQKEITALLGHNGAGKSTTMNIITGMTAPSNGTAVIDGRDIGREMKEIRKNLGFCPQYDIVYPELSVIDHMKFYGELKGISLEEVQKYSTPMFEQMKMTHALNTAAMSLSGGMKRKLSIAIAFLGNPTTIVLDEPTSAIDPFSRRAIWDVILGFRSRSTILISTHYMQEADLLGDRIAIIDKGTLKCCGSPMYLKSRYGSGFCLSVAHQAKVDNKMLERELQGFIPLTLKNTSNTESAYTVSLEAARSTSIISAFKFLETKGPEMGVTSFGISESTMEQVFFNVAEGGNVNHTDTASDSVLNKITYDSATGLSLCFIQIWATWVKRLHLSKRSKIGFVFQVLAPIVCTAVLLLVNNTIASQALNGQMEIMQPWNASWKNLMFYAGSQNGPFVDTILSQGIGTRCMSINPVPNKPCLSATSSTSLPLILVENSSSIQCNCNECPDNAMGSIANSVEILSNDTLISLQGRNITDYLLKTPQTGIIGGIVHAQIQNTGIGLDTFQNIGNWTAEMSGLNSSVWSALDSIFNSVSRKLYTVWTGLKVVGSRRQTKQQAAMVHMKGSFLNAYSNVLLRSMLDYSVQNPKDFGITYYTEEHSLTGDLSIVQAISGIIFGFFGSLALMMPTFTILLVIVNERSSGNKRLQLLMGMNHWVYWYANFLWDIVLYLFSVCLMIGFMAIFPKVFDTDLGLLFAISMMYGVSMILFGYNLSFFMNTARNSILLVGLIAPFFSIACMVIQVFSTEDWYESTNCFLNFFPPYFVTDCLMQMGFQKFYPENKREPIMSWNLLGKRFTINTIFSLVMLILLVCIESGVFSVFGTFVCTRKKNFIGIMTEEKDADADVKNEEKRILNSPDDSNTYLAVKKLLKAYSKKKVAVRGVTFGVQRGECFGLLGVNGAGKTTLFKMLAGFHRPTLGDAFIKGYSVFKQQSQVAKHMSYCPQEDVLYESLTPGEHLNFYGRVRGIPSKERRELVKAMINEVGLDPHAKKQSYTLSGGNKRKLNFAISVLDFPDVIFLDEMTTGMDPKARRAAWQALEKAIARGCAAVITSHSMEECEALCNRIVIMVNGVFQCIGGVQYLKDKYGNNYNVKFKLSSSKYSDQLLQKIQSKFPATKLVEQHIRYLEILIPAEGLQLSVLFQEIHQCKSEFEVEEFTASQTTLEHVFVNMVKDQE